MDIRQGASICAPLAWVLGMVAAVAVAFGIKAYESKPVKFGESVGQWTSVLEWSLVVLAWICGFAGITWTWAAIGRLSCLLAAIRQLGPLPGVLGVTGLLTVAGVVHARWDKVVSSRRASWRGALLEMAEFVIQQLLAVLFFLFAFAWASPLLLGGIGDTR